MVLSLYMAPWVPAFDAAISAQQAASHSPPFVLFLFATVGRDGGPRVRTLVYRGYLFNDRQTNVLTFVTDRRMGKYEELLHNDRFEAVFFFSETRKQFRLRGRARIVDGTHTPVIDTSSIRHRNMSNRMLLGADDSDQEPDELALSVASTLDAKKTPNNTGADVQSAPLDHGLLSPSLAASMSEKCASGLSYTNLQGWTESHYTPPSRTEWEHEINRQWGQLSKSMKKSFRKPPPGSPMTESSHKSIDSLSRGVDGKKDEDGLKNFALVALFVDYVDLYELDKDRRYVYERDSLHQWVEHEVCP